MLHPRQFQVNEAWILFRLDDEPIHTEVDGDFHCMVLMDAASCVILGMEMTPASEAEMSAAQVRHLLEVGRAHRQQLPGTLFVPKGPGSRVTTREAVAMGIEVVAVEETELLAFASEARKLFPEQGQGDR